MALEDLIYSSRALETPVDPGAINIARQVEQRRAIAQALAARRQQEMENQQRQMLLGEYIQRQRAGELDYATGLQAYREHPYQQNLANELAIGREMGYFRGRPTLPMIGERIRWEDIQRAHAGNLATAYGHAGIAAIPGVHGNVQFLPGGTLEAQREQRQRAYEQAEIQRQYTQIQQEYARLRQEAENKRAEHAYREAELRGEFEGRPTPSRMQAETARGSALGMIGGQPTRQALADLYAQLARQGVSGIDQFGQPMPTIEAQRLAEQRRKEAFQAGFRATQDAIDSGYSSAEASKIGNQVYQQFMGPGQAVEFGVRTAPGATEFAQDKAALDLLVKKRNIIVKWIENLRNYQAKPRSDWYGAQKQLDTLTKQLDELQKKTVIPAEKYFYKKYGSATPETREGDWRMNYRNK